MAPSRTSPLQALSALFRGYLPRVIQSRGWVLCALAVVPVLLSILGQAVARPWAGSSSQTALQVFHGVLVLFILPIMALVAAPGGIREDIEQRTLPLLLVRPVPVWVLPLGKGLVWFGWGALWLALSCAGLLLVGGEPVPILFQALALLLGFWAELAFMTLLGLVFSRGTLWGALVLFGWENLVRVLPGSLQFLTFHHHIESIAGSQGGPVAAIQILAQTQTVSSVPVSALALLLFGALCWALTGWKLQITPLGLAGAEVEG